MPGILVPCDGDASCPWEVWQLPESQGKLCGRAWRLEQPPTSQSSSPTTGPSFLLHLSLSLLPSTSPCQRLCKELELADTLISCRDCSTRAGLPGEGRKKEQQNFVPCHQGASFVRDASLLSTGPSGLLSCFATWVLLAVTGARAVFELWSSCWVGASPLGLPSGLLLADGDVLLLVSSFPALWKEKKKKELVLPSSPGVSYQGPLSTGMQIMVVYLLLQILGVCQPALPGCASPAACTKP